MKRGAKFSVDRKFRYVLWRIWNDKKPKVMFVGVNPSSADEFEDDPTITRLIGFCKLWGYGGFYILNMFPMVATKQKDLIPIKFYKNIKYIKLYSSKVNHIVFCWGNNKKANERSQILCEEFPNAMCFGHNKNKSPTHPLYLPEDTNLKRYFPW